MIYEITGQPGHGKTLYALWLARKFRAEGREVYAHGILGCDYAKLGFIELVDPAKWQEVPDNAVIFIDECYTVFPNRNAASPVPLHVEPLARHRHRGLDFILVHQQPNQVDPFVRGLVDTHHHVRRKFGLQAAVIKTWDYSTASPIKDAPLRAPTWKYPKEIYALYQSATMHTVKKTIPWQIYAVLPLVAFVAYVGYRLTSGESFSATSDTTALASAPATAPAGVGAGAGQQSQYTDTIDPAEQALAWLNPFKPRVPEYPTSAPAWDHREVRSEPMIACMIGERVGCICKTEQGTNYKLDQFKCIELVNAGGVYDPYREPENNREDYSREQVARGALPDVAAGPALIPSADGAAL